jgi:hypothetical protein
MARITWNSRLGPMRVRIPLHHMAITIRALGRSAHRAGRKMDRMAAVLDRNGPGYAVVASQRRRRHK